MGRRDYLTKKIYLVGSPKVGGAGDGKHKKKYGHPYEICIISYQVNLSSEVSDMFNSLMPSLNIRSLPFVVFLGGFPSRCQNLSCGLVLL